MFVEPAPRTLADRPRGASELTARICIFVVVVGVMVVVVVCCLLFIVCCLLFLVCCWLLVASSQH